MFDLTGNELQYRSSSIEFNSLGVIESATGPIYAVSLQNSDYAHHAPIHV